MTTPAFATAPAGAFCTCRRNVGLSPRSPLPPRPAARTPARVHAVWVKSSASIDVEADTTTAYDTYSNIQEMPQWCVTCLVCIPSFLRRTLHSNTFCALGRSPWLRAVRVDPNDRRMSEWVLFSRGIEISWKARTFARQPVHFLVWCPHANTL